MLKWNSYCIVLRLPEVSRKGWRCCNPFKAELLKTQKSIIGLWVCSPCPNFDRVPDNISFTDSAFYLTPFLKEQFAAVSHTNFPLYSDYFLLISLNGASHWVSRFLSGFVLWRRSNMSFNLLLLGIFRSNHLGE